MYPLVETIKIINGVPQNLCWHQKRFEYSYQKIFGFAAALKIEEMLEVPDEYNTGTVKSRFLYNKDSFEFEFSKYKSLLVKTLKLIENNTIDYPIKFTNRQHIEKVFERRGDCDDILIVKKGRVMDTSNSNIVFFDGENWITPEYPLLKGTTRERLISERKIIEKDILADDINSFLKYQVINSMNDFDENGGRHIKEIIKTPVNFSL
jgi:4-amino-4-deoxychorismate lyase